MLHHESAPVTVASLLFHKDLHNSHLSPICNNERDSANIQQHDITDDETDVVRFVLTNNRDDAASQSHFVIVRSMSIVSLQRLHHT